MPVIGRLDGQVEEVIIRPVSERRREEGAPAPRESEEAPKPPDPPGRATVQTPHPGESSPEADELPVWLL